MNSERPETDLSFAELPTDCVLCDHVSETAEEHERHMAEVHDGLPVVLPEVLLGFNSGWQQLFAEGSSTCNDTTLTSEGTYPYPDAGGRR